MGSLSLNPKQPQCCQNLIVMRHGDRIDDFVESWRWDAARPWDPPLVNAGLVRAFQTGVKLRSQLGFPIRRVFVSPFMRCVETASLVVSALCAVCDPYPESHSGTDLPIDPSKIKASIEYGLCEVMNRATNREQYPEDGDWGFNLLELQKKFPAGTVDHGYEPLFEELPKWGETSLDGRARIGRVIQALADKYPSENLLLITHGEGLRATVARFANGTRTRNVEYCAHVQLQRQITLNDDGSCTTEKFGVVSRHGYSLRI